MALLRNDVPQTVDQLALRVGFERKNEQKRYGK